MPIVPLAFSVIIMEPLALSVDTATKASGPGPELPHGCAGRSPPRSGWEAAAGRHSAPSDGRCDRPLQRLTHATMLRPDSLTGPPSKRPDTGHQATRGTSSGRIVVFGALVGNVEFLRAAEFPSGGPLGNPDRYYTS